MNVHEPEHRYHTLVVTVENKSGVLARVASLFARRAFNIGVVVKVGLYNMGAVLFLLGSVWFLESLIEFDPGWGAWMFVAGSVCYTLGAGYDCLTAYIAVRGAVRRAQQAGLHVDLLWLRTKHA